LPRYLEGSDDSSMDRRSTAKSMRLCSVP
jgi:hypothetical protein